MGMQFWYKINIIIYYIIKKITWCTLPEDMWASLKGQQPPPGEGSPGTSGVGGCPQEPGTSSLQRVEHRTDGGIQCHVARLWPQEGRACCPSWAPMALPWPPNKASSAGPEPGSRGLT